MNKSPFKVMTTAALASAVAVPAVVAGAAAPAEAAEVEIQHIAIEDSEGTVWTITMEELADAQFEGDGEVYDLLQDGEIVGVSVEEGEFVSYTALVNAVFDSEDDRTSLEILADISDDEEALVPQDQVDEYKDFGEPVTPMVESVSAINLKQVSFEYSGDVDMDALVDSENYTLEDVEGNNLDSSVDNVEVNEDEQTVTLTLDTNVDNQTDAVLTVDSDVTGEEVESELTFFDTTVPSVEGGSVIGSDTLKVQFSEPLAVKDISEDDEAAEWVLDNEDETSVKEAFEVTGDGSYYISDVTFQKNNTEAQVTLYSDIDEDTIEVSVDSMLEDYAGYSVTEETLELDMVEDEEAPELVDYKNATPNSVTLVFNEDIKVDDSDLEDLENFYHTNSNNTVVETPEVDGNELTLTFANGEDADEDNPLPEGTAYIYVDGEIISDFFNNEVDSQLRTQIDVDVDEVAPELTEVDASEEEINLTFSEDVSAEEEDFMVLDENGEEDDVINGITVEGDEVTIETDELQGDYALVVDGVEDLSVNEIEKVTKEFFVADEDAPDLEEDADATFYEDEDNEEHVLVVNYPEAMAVDGEYSVTDLNKYVLDDEDLADVEGASVKAINDNTAVEITIPDENWDGSVSYSGDADLQIGRVEDLAGNKTALSSDVEVNAESSVEVKDVYASDNYTVVAELGDRLDTFEEDDFAFTGADASDLSLDKVSTDINDDGNTVITWEFDEANAIPSDVEALDLEVNGEASENVYGESVNNDTFNVDDHISPEVVDEDDNEIFEAGSNEITITFDEALNIPSENGDLAATDLVLTDDDGDLEPGTDYTVSTASDDLVIELDEDYNYEGTIDVKTDEGSVAYIVDGADEPNTIANFEIDDVEVDTTSE
ncbi:hypothetical protein GLW08_10375 [Pontibacillus yanchengensis]|uniref:Uncharacterized protein n=1 Tax=Pontibacillus yanchengensis TaxID=462910 RepID=A0ACC7VFK1_9BACI|nr:SwmB domain-containing protein [Pontibacillus yanchengensis]MYL53741.1 hypothetical protein [Pontibacillus yanchengensis]